MDDRIKQNKRTYMATIFEGYFHFVIHMFLLKDDTYMSCGSEFGIIEKCKRTAELFTLRDVVEMIGEAGMEKKW